MERIKSLSIFAAILIFIVSGSIAGHAQTTEFSYEGTLNNSGINGNFDFEFRLFDTSTGGTLIGSQQSLSVVVTNGEFSVVLNFGEFPPENRFLEIGVRELGTTTFTTLARRDKLLSTPYSTQAKNAENAVNAENALNAQTAATSTNATNAQNAQTAQNALQLGGTPANQFVLGNDPRLGDPRTPVPGSPSYIQNGTNQQTASNFNITGNGTAGGTLTGNVVNATTHLSIGGFPVLRSLSFNLFTGLQAGFNNTTGDKNSFFGTGAAAFNTTGNNNSAFGVDAGRFNLTGSDNSIFGADAGRLTSTGYGNSFFGYESGESNASGRNNSFFGSQAGKLNTGEWNTFIGKGAGELSTDTANNTFVGASAGDSNTTGVENAFFGTAAGGFNTTGSFNTIIGPFADVGARDLTNAAAIGSLALVTRSNSIVLGRVDDTNVGIGTTAPLDRLHVNGIIRVTILGGAGLTSICRNASNQISTCSSSLRYKTGISPFLSGLNIAKRLQPISFTWKDGGARDLGFGAEDVAAIEPLLVTHNEKGEVEGVKYDRIAVVLLNAVKEQQTQITRQQEQIDELKQIVCSLNPAAVVCKANR